MANFFCFTPLERPSSFSRCELRRSAQTHPTQMPNAVCIEHSAGAIDRAIVRASGRPWRSRPSVRAAFPLARLVRHSFHVPSSAFSNPRTAGYGAGRALPGTWHGSPSNADFSIKYYCIQSNHFTESVSLLHKANLQRVFPKCLHDSPAFGF